MKTLQSNSRAFIILELIFIIILLGIINTLFFKNQTIQEYLCTIKITKNLQKIQVNLADTFTQHYYNSTTPKYQTILTIFEKYTNHNTSSCSLIFQKQKKIIIATNYQQQAFFYLMPKDLSKHPQITCLFNNKLCKKIHNRISAK